MLQKFHCEHVLEELGNCGYYQKLLIAGFLIPFAVLVALQSNTLHNELVPDHWCRVALLENFSYGEQHRLIRPLVKSSVDGHDQYRYPVALSKCELYDIDYGEVVSGLQVKNKNGSVKAVPTAKCNDGWVYNRLVYEDSAAMHYNFVCDQRDTMKSVHWIRGMASALLCPLYGLFVDRFGRKPGLILVMFVFLFSSISPIITTNYYAFLVCQALNGSTFPIAMFILLIFGIEFMTPPNRTYVLAFCCMAFHFGQWISFLLTHAFSNWYSVTICNTVTVLPYFFLFYFVDESPQWLLARNHPQQLKIVFARLNRINLAKLDDDSLDSIISKFTHFYDFNKTSKPSNQSQKTSTEIKSPYVKEDIRSEISAEEAIRRPVWNTVKLFIKRSTLFQMMLLFSYILITNQLIADFMSSYKHQFDDNVVVEKFLGSLIKMPVIVFVWYLLGQRIGRRWSNCLVLALNLLMLSSFIFSQWLLKKIIWLNVTITVSSIILTKCSIIITVLQTIELSPTRYRTIILSIVYLIGKVSSIYLIDVFNNHSLRLILTFYTKSVLLIGMTLIAIIVSTFVAETRNEFLPLGLLASEQLITNVLYWSLSKKKSDIAPSNLFLSLSKWDINSNHQIVGSIKHLEKFTDS